MKALSAIAFLVVGLSSVSESQQPVSARAAFSVTLRRMDNGWTAQCDSGCRWQQASFNCDTACAAIVDANGLVTVRTPRPQPTSFAFIVYPLPDGARAEARVGSSWRSLSWTCGILPCQARVDAAGVSVRPALR